MPDVMLKTFISFLVQILKFYTFSAIFWKKLCTTWQYKNNWYD